MDKIIYQVDAFTETHFGGNPAGVVPDARELTADQMQKIAREMNLSETAFIFPLNNEEADFEVRFFTPTQEVELCGHATIGAFYALAKKGYLHGTGDVKIIRQKTKAGILPVEIYFANEQVEMVMMTQAKPKFVSKSIDVETLAKGIGISMKDIGIEGYEAAPEIISTGLEDIIVPIKNLEILKRLTPNMSELREFSKKLDVVGVHVFTLETEEKGSTLACRNFGPAVGIDEESATGTANGALGVYIAKNQLLPFHGELTLVCEQGYYMDRPSKVMVELHGNKEDLTVKVGGKAVITLEGVMQVK